MNDDKPKKGRKRRLTGRQSALARRQKEDSTFQVWSVCSRFDKTTPGLIQKPMKKRGRPSNASVNGVMLAIVKKRIGPVKRGALAKAIAAEYLPEDQKTIQSRKNAQRLLRGDRWKSTGGEPRKRNTPYLGSIWAAEKRRNAADRIRLEKLAHRLAAAKPLQK